MLNILNIKKNYKSLETNKTSLVKHNIKKYLPATKLWLDSTYNYNNVNNKLLSHNNNIVNYYFSNYLSFYKTKDQWSRKLIRAIRRKWRKSSKRLYTGIPEIKHTNDKIIITMYTYNKKQHVLYSKLRKNIRKIFVRYKNKSKINLIKQIKIIKKFSDLYNVFTNNNSNLLKNKLNYIKYRFVKKNTMYKKLKKVLYISKLLYIETKKTNNIFLDYKYLGIISLLKTLYGKNIELDLINHKSIFSNSNSIASAIAFKLKNRKTSLKRVLRKVLTTKIPPKHLFFKDNVKKDIKTNVLSNLDYKVVNGIRFEMTGRLTRRLTAMRSLRKVNYKGGRKNIRSSFRKLSTLLARNSVNSNLQYTNLSGKTRNGAFGLKCWISSI